MSGGATSGVLRVVVGLDFGTHSTKCIIRPLGTDHISLFRFASRGNAGGYPWFAEPSLVRVVGQQLRFGYRALSVVDGTLFRSLKVQLLPPETGLAQDYPEFPPGTSPDLFITCYLSRLLRLVRKRVEDRFGNHDVKILLNMAAPMDHFEDEALKSRYLQIINSAWESVFGEYPFEVRNGVRIDDVHRYFDELLQVEVEGVESRPFDVLPETIAPIVSMQDDPRVAPGFYLMLDMGAGTSEFSVNLVNERGADQKVVCYFDRTRRVGGDHFEQAAMRYSDHAALEEHLAALVQRVTRGVKETCFEGFGKDSANGNMRAKWRRLQLFFTGGAARNDLIQKDVRSLLPIEPHLPGEEQYTASWYEPRLPRGLDVTPTESSLLAVSHGLSIHRRHWPTVFEPRTVESLEADTVIEQPEAYWYIDD